MGLLDGKVAIVTGAGGGIGRCHALALAREGAKVVVNDVGGALDGRGEQAKPADAVVQEIEALGGQARANYDSVSSPEGAAAIVQTALDAFGRADVLVNNAGILRDKTLLKLDDADWNAVIDVHLTGTFLCTRAFARHVKQRADDGDRGGRVINTSSYAGLKGNFGQTNYSAAKAGIYGLTLTWSQELARLGVTVNCIAPMAKTRMTERIDMIPDSMRPEQVAPLAVFFASPLADDVTGRIIGVHGQQLLEYSMLMTDGVTKDGADLWTPAEIAERLLDIAATASPSESPAPAGPQAMIDAGFTHMPQIFVPAAAQGWSATLHFDITDGEGWTVRIADGQCTTERGLQGEPTCVVTVDQATYAEILEGKQKPEQAFMNGKIKATNLGDMMKFGQAFDLKKGRALLQQSAPAAAPAAAPAGPQAMIDAGFTHMPQIFVPAAAQGWSATLHFDITDGEGWTVRIADGQCTTERGLQGEPTCVVTVDQATYAEILEGKQKPEQAFMNGKIKATNLGDMMKFGQAFDLKKGRALMKEGAPAAAAAAAAPVEEGPQAQVDRALAVLPRAFKADAAPGWSAVVQVVFEDGEPWTLEVADGVCSARKGAHGEATLTIKTALSYYAQVVRGELSPEKAFMTGAIKPSNLTEMMKFGKAFDLKQVKALVTEAIQPAAAPAVASAPPAAPSTGLNRDKVGEVYTGPPQFLEPSHAEAYAAATGDANPAYGVDLAPPMVAVRLLKEPLFTAMLDEDLRVNMQRLVHGEQDMEFLQPLKPWDLCATRVTVAGIQEKRSGELLELEERIYREGELAVRVRASMFIRGASGGGSKAKTTPEPEATPTPSWTYEVTVDADQSLRYADASLDRNPIHTDPEIAKLAGFKGVILHGLCSMAFAARGVVERACGGDPRKLARLAVRFSKPVFMGDTLTVEGWPLEGEDGDFGVRVVNQEGVEVITQGKAWIR